jgi:hypothetical protein
MNSILRLMVNLPKPFGSRPRTLKFEPGFDGLLPLYVAHLAEQCDTAAIMDEYRHGEQRRVEFEWPLSGPASRAARGAGTCARQPRECIAILVDNLDKAWQSGADLELLPRLLLGLLTVVGRIVDEFKKESSMKASVNVTLTVFLRSDIMPSSVIARVSQTRLLRPRSSGEIRSYWREF